VEGIIVLLGHSLGIVAQEISGIYGTGLAANREDEGCCESACNESKITGGHENPPWFFGMIGNSNASLLGIATHLAANTQKIILFQLKTHIGSMTISDILERG
jgi:hypothetical protein